MAKRSTRGKILHQRDKIRGYIVSILESLQYIDTLADGNSDVITSGLPSVVSLTVLFEKGIEKFLSKL